MLPIGIADEAPFSQVKLERENNHAAHSTRAARLIMEARAEGPDTSF